MVGDASHMARLCKGLIHSVLFYFMNFSGQKGWPPGFIRGHVFIRNIDFQLFAKKSGKYDVLTVITQY